MTRTHQFPPQLERNYTVVAGRIQTRSLEAHIVDHCNLTCEGCCSLSPLLPRWFADASDLERDLLLAREVLSPRVFKLVGGEPLLHPEVVSLVRLAKRAAIAPTVSITTNGLLLLRMPTALWENVDALTISLYPSPVISTDDRNAIVALAQRFNVTLNWKTQNTFVQMDREAPSTNLGEVKAIYDECWLRERCHMIRNGRFYTCTRPPHFQTLFGEAVDLSADGLALEDHPQMLNRMLGYLQREEPLESCMHCLGGSAAQQPHRLLSKDELHTLRVKTR